MQFAGEPPQATRRPVATFFAVRLEGLVPDSVLAFDLYVQSAPGQYLLWHAAGHEFTSAHCALLRENGTVTLWLTPEGEREYEHYVEKYLETLLGEGTTVQERAALLYSAAHTTLSAVMRDPRHADAVPRTRRLAREMVHLIMKEPDALAHMSALMARDYDTVRHSMNVSIFATALGFAAGIRTAGELQELTQGTLLHDVGKSEVPRDIIVKPGAYTPLELALMRMHVSHGERILRQDGRLGDLGMYAVSQHHERMDGLGYPRKVPGPQLHLFGRVTGICDVYDALTSDRSYKRAMAPVDALQLMRGQMGPHFDQALLHTFIRTLRSPSKAKSLSSVA